MCVLCVMWLLLHQSSTLKFSVVAVDADVAREAIKMWVDDNIHIMQVDDESAADVVIRLMDESYMSAKKLNGEQIGRIININRSRKFNALERRNLIAHEVGHFLGKPHDAEPSSIMNSAVPLSKRTIDASTKNMWKFRAYIMMQKARSMLIINK